MTYLDYGATSLNKPIEVKRAVQHAIEKCGNPGRGGHAPAMLAASTVLRCRERAGEFFHCAPEQVVMTSNCTHGLNMAIETLVDKGSRVVISGFEHNAVTRPLFARHAQVTIAGRKVFDTADTMEQFERALKAGADAVVVTHASNVFGYVLPIDEIGALCKQYGVPFVVDAAQSAGILPVEMDRLGAEFVAMPGHKGLLGPQGTGLLLCNRMPKPLMQGGTGSVSMQQQMPDFLPDGAEAGTLNVAGIAGLSAGIQYIIDRGLDRISKAEISEARRCGKMLEKLGFRAFTGDNQIGTVSFVPKMDCEEMAERLAKRGIAVRAGLHCAPLAHESAGTLETGTVRVSYGYDAAAWQTERLIQEVKKIQMET